MTTINFEEDIRVKQSGKTLKVEEFFGVLEENGYFPLLHEATEDEITPEIQSSYLESKKSKNRINI
ncbi:hypothetical protein MK079_02430 [Candidatus Gracilibacteria bacterium]|nr:hypothetical protein [Candidatus Gracilibacteria bacterium]